MNRTIIAAAAAVLLTTAAPMPSPMTLGPTAALAQSAVVLENLNFSGPMGSLRIPQVTVEGSSATRAEIAALFDASALPQLAGRLSALSARSVSIPLIELTQSTGELTSVTTYRDTVIRDIRNGIVGEMIAPVATVKAVAKAGQKDMPGFDMDFADMTLKGIDLPLMLRFLYDKAAPGEGMKLAAVEQTIGKIRYQIGDIATVTIDNASVKDFKLRPLRQPLIDLVGKMQGDAAGLKREPDKETFLTAIDLLTSISYGDTELNGLKGTFTSPIDKTNGTFAIAKISGAGGGDVDGRFNLQGFSVDTGSGKIELREFALDKLDMSAIWTAIRDEMSKPDGDITDLDPAAMIPKLGLLRFAGLDVNVPDPKAKGQMVTAKLERFETRMANHVGPIPANIGINIDKFRFDIPKDTREKGLKDILALGYAALDMSLGYEQLWDEAKKTLSLKNFNANAAGMFQATASAEIANVPREVFTLDKAKAAVAALGAAARSLNVTIVNEGLVERLMAQQASQQKRKVEDVKAEMAAGAALIVPMMMGDHPGAKALGGAFGKFVADPKNVKVTLTAKGEGLGAMDFLAASNPMDVLKKVDIRAGANE